MWWNSPTSNCTNRKGSQRDKVETFHPCRVLQDVALWSLQNVKDLVPQQIHGQQDLEESLGCRNSTAIYCKCQMSHPAINKNPNTSTIKVITSSHSKNQRTTRIRHQKIWVLYIFSVYRFEWNKPSSPSLNKQLCWICFKTTLDQQIKMITSQTISFCGL